MTGRQFRMTERCLWTETATREERTSISPSAALPGSTDVAVIGAGYTGLSAALTLARRATDVTVLEQHTIGWGASGRNGGFVLPGYKPEMEELARMLGPERARRMFELSLEAIAYLERLIREQAIECDFVRSGAVTLAAKPRHLRALEASGRFLQEELSYETQLLGRDEMAREIGSHRYHGALVDPAAASLQPARYVRGLGQAARRAGARVLEGTELTGLTRVPGGFELKTSAGVVRAREVLAATNGYTPPALARLRRRVIPIGSHLIATRPLGDELARRLIPRGRVLSDTKHLLYYFRLSPDCRMVFGGRASFTPTSMKRTAAILHAGMSEVFPELAEVPVEYAWSGKVAYPIDHLPHVGRLDGVHYAMGYCGHGVALATYLGNRMGEVLSGSAELPDLGTDRFAPIPLFSGVPWFLPFVGGYYRVRDWLN
jgi:glycine/D-amino acid oxidase-like deaminating enzyme